MSLAEIDAMVTALFCGDVTPHGSYRAPGGGAQVKGIELLADALYRYDLVERATATSVTLQLYVGVDGLGEGLWRQEVRVLQRVASLGHPALPQMVDGGTVEKSVTSPYSVSGCAFVVTRRSDGMYDAAAAGDNTRAGLTEIIDALKASPSKAVAHLMSLADALAILHDMGIVHRNIWPGTIEYTASQNEEQLILARFEMSSLVSNLLRSSLRDAGERAEQARKLIVGQGADALAYFSRERLEFLLNEGARLEDHRSDIYSLGMVAAEWFTGAIPAELLRAVTSAISGDTPELDGLLAANRAINTYMRDAVKSLPGPLAVLLRDMLSWDKPTGRPSAADVVSRISDHYEHLVSDSASAPSGPHLLIFMPEECRDTLLKWELVDLDPMTPEGKEETSEFIRADLKNARFLHLPNGAEPFVPGNDPEKRRAADHVFLGRNMAWFCRPYEPVIGFNRRGAPDDRGLVIAFVLGLDTGRGHRLKIAVERASKRRWVPSVHIVPSDIDKQEMQEKLEASPSWRPLFEAVYDAAPQTKAEREFSHAFDWLLQFQRTELEARQYPYIADGAGERDRVVLRFDEERDRRWRFSSAMATVFAGTASLRPNMGDFFHAARSNSGITTVLLRADDDGVPARRVAISLECVGGHNDTVEVAAGHQTRSVPSRGWITLAEDSGSWVALRRQEDARAELLANRVLVQQLATPRAVEMPRLTKRSTTTQVAEAMSKIEPLFALQGPPGTGKTEVTAEAILAYLKAEPGSRVLVSTQSNFALDNIAERLLRKLGMVGEDDQPATSATDVVAVRATTEWSSDKVDELVRPFLINDLAERRQQEIVERTEQLLVNADDHTRSLLAQWPAIVRDGLPELIDRLHRSANLVFATCSSATPALLTQSASTDLFDWVVIEEAAKAWPTELAIPLARGTRWAVVGDHRQLPAHRRREIVDFLDECASSSIVDLQLHGQRKDAYLAVFDLFGQMFEGAADPAVPRPRHTMRTQYRMRDAISQIVSRMFYPVTPTKPGEHTDINRPGLLETGRDDNGILHAPAGLARHAVVWIDTTDSPLCEEESAWRNAGEVQIIEQLLASLRPRPVPKQDGYGDHPVAVLSPYRLQLELLRTRPDLKPYASTIHAFQGREANVVVVSLVRNQKRGPVEQPWRNIGHLHEPELVNVLFSRAREHLVLVGSFRHFQYNGGPMWADICTLVEKHGIVRKAADFVEA
ncbi:AAA domain-containing protein [Kutzneria kofuensis]|uniref:Serine/threonine protein kinase n=1 Tax=Kutzneria kofuensis TaxID=103725 RepID=A0A7W9KJN6_9PSEU|nr:AAA domain-containing protein [Kutzneria kofuensis]MBB5893805.1 serine/threonine protein kinase [Kutzneria kofuensis]